MRTRGEQLQWAKNRAGEYLNAGDHAQAWASFCSDMVSHPETMKHPGLQLGSMLQFGAGGLSNVAEVRDFIQGFN